MLVRINVSMRQYHNKHRRINYDTASPRVTLLSDYQCREEQSKHKLRTDIREKERIIVINDSTKLNCKKTF